jgi:hypothetical protein
MVMLVRDGLGNGDELTRRLAGGIPGGSAGLAGGAPVIPSWPSFFLPLFCRRKEKTRPLWASFFVECISIQMVEK